MIVVEYSVQEAVRHGFSRRGAGYCGGGGCCCGCNRDSCTSHFVHTPKFNQAVAPLFVGHGRLLRTEKKVKRGFLIDERGSISVEITDALLVLRRIETCSTLYQVPGSLGGTTIYSISLLTKPNIKNTPSLIREQQKKLMRLDSLSPNWKYRRIRLPFGEIRCGTVSAKLLLR